jgi:arsenate reductase (thioredoxin)
MTAPESMAELSVGDRLQLGNTLSHFQQEFAGRFDDETIEHFVVDSYARLALTAKVREYLGVLSERFARERLGAMLDADRRADSPPGVLFLCVHNAGRSQMAAGFLRSVAGDRIRVYTGGSEPVGLLNPVAVAAMAEAGVDISQEFPKPWTEEVVRAVDVIVAMGCGDVCPVYPGTRRVEWDLDDPEGQPIDVVRRIRDLIELHVDELAHELLGEKGALR